MGLILGSYGGNMVSRMREGIDGLALVCTDQSLESAFSLEHHPLGLKIKWSSFRGEQLV